MSSRILETSANSERWPELLSSKKLPDFQQFNAVIFDLDGTLVHSEHVWDMAKLEVMGRYGLCPSRELLTAHIGRGLNGFLDDVFGRPLSTKEHKEIGDQIGARADELLPDMRTPVRGAADFLCKLQDCGLRVAICSSSPRRHIASAVEVLSITERVEVIVSGADLPHGKPDPLPYLATLETLGLSPVEACAVEDSMSGVASALAAGLTVLAIGEGCTQPGFEGCAYQAEGFGSLYT